MLRQRDRARTVGVLVLTGLLMTGSGRALSAGKSGSGPGVGVAAAPAVVTDENVLSRGSTCRLTWGEGFPGGDFDSSIEALAVYDDGNGPRLYAGGFFEEAGGASASKIARWEGDSWSVLGDGVSDWVHAMAAYDDGPGEKLYVGGRITSAGGETVNHIARWDGTNWSSIGGSLNERVFALHVHDDGSGPQLYVGGAFNFVEGNFVPFIARWDGSDWSSVGSGMNSRVYAMTTFDDGSGPALYAGGWFQVAGGEGASRVAKWNGTSWSGLGDGVDGDVYALAVYDDGSGPALYAGGVFINAGEVEANYVAKWDGKAWSALGSGMDGFPIGVKSLAVFDDGSGPALYAGGAFSSAGGASAANIAKWDGSSWSALGPGIGGGPATEVLALLSFDDGTGSALYAGGFFGSAGGFPALNIARWGCVDTVIPPCACGDLDGSGGAVNLVDFSIFQTCFGHAAPSIECTPSAFFCADANRDGVVNLIDFPTFSTVFGTVSTNSPPMCLE